MLATDDVLAELETLDEDRLEDEKDELDDTLERDETLELLII